MRRQIGSDLIDDSRRNQRLVALNIDHDGVRGQLQLSGHLGQAVGAGVVPRVGQQHLGTKGLAGFDDARVVGGDDHAAGGTFLRLLPDMLDHGLAGDVLQRLAGQTTGRIAGRNDDGKGDAHAYLSRRSSVLRVRASLSSITGMPSRIG